MAGTATVRSWLTEADIRVLTDAEVPIARILSNAADWAAKGRKLTITGVGSPVFPTLTGRQNALHARVMGYVEADGHPFWQGGTRARMIVAVAALRASEERGYVSVSGAEIVHSLIERNAGEGSGRYIARITGWSDAAYFLDSLPGRRSVYAEFVAEVVEAAGALRRNGVVDVADVARRVFSVGDPSALVRAAVRYWLTREGLRGLVDSSEGPVREPVRLFSRVPREVATRLVSLARTTTPRMTRPFSNMTGQRRADLALRKAAELVVSGERFTLERLAELAFGTPDADAATILRMGAFLEIGGLGEVVGRTFFSSEYAAQAFAEARSQLRRGEGVVPREIATRLPHGGKVSPVAEVVRGWLVAVGLMGGPLDPDGLLGSLRGVVRGLGAGYRARGLEPDLVEIARRAFGEPAPTAVQVAVVVEWLDDDDAQVLRQRAGEVRRVDAVRGAGLGEVSAGGSGGPVTGGGVFGVADVLALAAERLYGGLSFGEMTEVF
ncbi:hypothetical protein, partial [Streptomyces sp. NPDC058548]